MANVHTTELSDLETTTLVNLLLKEAKEYEALAQQMDNVTGGRDSFTYRATELRVMAVKLLHAPRMKAMVKAADEPEIEAVLPRKYVSRIMLSEMARVMYETKTVKLKHGLTGLPLGVMLELYNASWFRTRDNKGVKDQTAEQLLVRASFPDTVVPVVFSYKELDSLNGVWIADQVVEPSLASSMNTWLVHNTLAIAKFYLVRKPKVSDYIDLLTNLAHH